MTVTVVNRETAELVLYHGTRRRMHGEWLLAGPCICARCVRGFSFPPSGLHFA